METHKTKTNDSISRAVRLVRTSPKSLRSDVEKLLAISGFSCLDPKKRTLLKINGNVDRFYPGSNTSCWFLVAVIECLKERGFNDFAVIEGDLPLFTVEQMLQRTGMDRVLARHKIECINLQHQSLNDKEIPLILHDAQLINLPTMHTHGFAVISCATKNLWGFLPVHRFRYHHALTEKLLELYRTFDIFTVVDGTVSMKGDSTRTGIPLRTDFLMAGFDMLALDAVAARIMKFELMDIPLLAKAYELKMLPETIVVEGDASWNSVPEFDCRFKKGVARKMTMWMEGLSGGGSLPKTISRILHSPLVNQYYNQVVGLYVNLYYRRNRKTLMEGPWMEYMKWSME